MNEIAIRGQTLPGIVENEIDAMIDGFVRTIETDSGKDEMLRLPDKNERMAIEQRRQSLTRQLEPAGSSMTHGDKIMTTLGELWLCYPSLRNADIGAMSAAYFMDLERLPLFAVLAAIDDVRRGRIKSLDPDWPPTSPRIVDRAQDHIEPVARSLTAAKRVLAVTHVRRPDDPEVRDRAHQEIMGFLQARSMEYDEREQRVREDVCRRMGETSQRMIRDEYRALGVEPVQSGPFTFSPSLLRSLGRDPKQRRRE